MISASSSTKVGADIEKNNQIKIYSPMTNMDFRAFVRIPIRHIDFSSNEQRNSHFHKIRDWVFELAQREIIVEYADVTEFLTKIGVTKNVFEHYTKHDAYQTLIVRVANGSTCKVHVVPLKRKNVPGASCRSWLSKLHSEDQLVLEQNIHLFKKQQHKSKRSN